MLKRTIATVATLLISAAAFAASPASYSGNWKLDMAQSKNLPKVYKDVTAGELNVTQDDKQLAVDMTIQSKSMPNDFKQTFVYKLDGTETSTQTVMHTPAGEQSVPTTLRGVAMPNGQLLLTETRQITLNDKSTEAASAERWKLSDDQKTLTVHRRDQMPKGVVEYDMVFTRS